MSRGRILCLVLFVVCTAAGCGLFSRREKPLPKLDTSGSVTRSSNDDEMIFAVVSQLIEQPTGNEYLNQGLWLDAADPLPHSLSALLASNGIRLGVIRGPIPQELARLGSSEASSQGLTQRGFSKDQPRVISLNGPVPAISLNLTKTLTSTPESLKLVGADCGLSITVSPEDGALVKVRIEPQISHGEKQSWLVPSADGSGFQRTDRQAQLNLPEFAWEVTLGRKDALLVGATEDPAGKLGHAYFFTANNRRQRVFLLQAARANPDDDERPKSMSKLPSASIAAQAYRTPRR